MVAMAVVVGCAVGLEVLAVLVVVMVRGLVAVAMAVVTAMCTSPNQALYCSTLCECRVGRSSAGFASG